MTHNLPEIIIKNAWLFRENISVHLHELWAGETDKLATHEQMDETVRAYQKAWRPHEETILSAMCEMLDIEFAHNIIDVYIAPWMKAISDPLIIGVKFEPDEFVDILTHELLHRLLSANKATGTDASIRRMGWKNMFGDNHSFKTLVHIPVHACAKAIYLDALEDKYRLERDIEDCQQWSGYKEAWDYVEANDYREIIEQLKNSYKNLPANEN